MSDIKNWSSKKNLEELLEIKKNGSLIIPESAPILENIDYHYGMNPYDGCIGGDHLMFIDFKEYNLEEKIEIAKKKGDSTFAKKLEQNFHRLGIMILDVMGHGINKSVLTAHLHAATTIAIEDEINNNAEVTDFFMERVNNYYHRLISPNFMSPKPFATALYGEMYNSGFFKWINSGHLHPATFSYDKKKLVVFESQHIKNSTPLGILPSRYHVNLRHFKSPLPNRENSPTDEIYLLEGKDTLLLYTDGLTEQNNGQMNFLESGLEDVLIKNKDKNAKDTYNSIISSLREYSPQEDDLALVVIKKKK